MSNQYGFYVDTSRCIKCWACQVSCKQWNEIPAGTTRRRWLVEEDEGVFPDVNRRFFSTSCNHCEKPELPQIRRQCRHQLRQHRKIGREYSFC